MEVECRNSKILKTSETWGYLAFFTRYGGEMWKSGVRKTGRLVRRLVGGFEQANSFQKSVPLALRKDDLCRNGQVNWRTSTDSAGDGKNSVDSLGTLAHPLPAKVTSFAMSGDSRVHPLAVVMNAETEIRNVTKLHL